MPPPPAGPRRGHARPWAFLALGAALWIVVWAWMGFRVASEVRGLRSLSGTVVSVGVAAQETETALRSLAELPLVGDRLTEPARRIGEAGRSAVASGRASRESADNLSVLLGVSIGVIPSTPALLLVILWRREGRVSPAPAPTPAASP